MLLVFLLFFMFILPLLIFLCSYFFSTFPPRSGECLLTAHIRKLCLGRADIFGQNRCPRPMLFFWSRRVYLLTYLLPTNTVHRCLRAGPSGPGTQSRATWTSTLKNSNCCCPSWPTTWWDYLKDCFLFFQIQENIATYWYITGQYFYEGI